jgi:uncharacterized membrane protein
METVSVSYMGGLMLGGKILLVIILILVVVLLAIRRNPKVKTENQPVVSSNPEMRGQQRETILEGLANKEITQEEAERQLLDLDTPLPEQMPAPLPAGKGCGKGCLVAVICGVVAFVVIILLLFLMLFGLKAQTIHHAPSIQIQEMNS